MATDAISQEAALKAYAEAEDRALMSGADIEDISNIRSKIGLPVAQEIFASSDYAPTKAESISVLPTSKLDSVAVAAANKKEYLANLTSSIQSNEATMFSLTQQSTDLRKEADLFRDRDTGEVLQDTGVNLLKSGLSIGEGVVGTANFFTGGLVEEATGILDGFQRVKGLTDSLKSDKLKSQEQSVSTKLDKKNKARDIALEEIEGGADTIDYVSDFLGRVLEGGAEVISNPAALGSFAAESSMSFLVPAGVANFVKESARKGLQKKLVDGSLYKSIPTGLTVEARKAAEKAIIKSTREAVDKKGAFAALASIGAIEGASNAAESAAEMEQYRAETTENRTFLLTNSPLYGEMIESGLSHDEAVDELKENRFLLTYLVSATGAALTSRFTGTDKLLGGLLDKSSLGKVMGDIVRGTANETVEELGQSGIGQFSQNLAAKLTTDKNQALDENVATQAGLGAAIGGVSGGVTAGTVSGVNTAVGKARTSLKDIVEDTKVTDTVFAAVEANDYESLNTIKDKAQVAIRLLDERVTNAVYQEGQDPEVIKNHLRTTHKMADSALQELEAKSTDVSPSEASALNKQRDEMEKVVNAVIELATSFNDDKENFGIESVKQAKGNVEFDDDRAYSIFGSSPKDTDDETLSSITSSIANSKDLSPEAKKDLESFVKARKTLNAAINTTDNNGDKALSAKVSDAIINGGEIGGVKWRGALTYFNQAKVAAAVGSESAVTKATEELDRFTATHTEKYKLARNAFNLLSSEGKNSPAYQAANKAYGDYTTQENGKPGFINEKSRGLVVSMQSEVKALRAIQTEVGLITKNFSMEKLLKFKNVEVSPSVVTAPEEVAPEEFSPAEAKPLNEAAAPVEAREESTYQQIAEENKGKKVQVDYGKGQVFGGTIVGTTKTVLSSNDGEYVALEIKTNTGKIVTADPNHEIRGLTINGKIGSNFIPKSKGQVEDKPVIDERNPPVAEYGNVPVDEEETVNETTETETAQETPIAEERVDVVPTEGEATQEKYGSKFSEVEAFDTEEKFASTDKDGNIKVLKTVEVDKFYKYFTGSVDSTTSKQKAKLLEILGEQGTTLERIKEFLDTPEKIKEFLVRHEQSHVTNKDREVYWKNGKDLVTDDKLAIELRATMDALDEMGFRELAIEAKETFVSKLKPLVIKEAEGTTTLEVFNSKMKPNILNTSDVVEDLGLSDKQINDIVDSSLKDTTDLATKETRLLAVKKFLANTHNIALSMQETIHEFTTTKQHLFVEDILTDKPVLAFTEDTADGKKYTDAFVNALAVAVTDFLNSDRSTTKDINNEYVNKSLGRPSTTPVSKAERTLVATAGANRDAAANIIGNNVLELLNVSMGTVGANFRTRLVNNIGNVAFLYMVKNNIVNTSSVTGDELKLMVKGGVNADALYGKKFSLTFYQAKHDIQFSKVATAPLKTYPKLISEVFGIDDNSGMPMFEAPTKVAKTNNRGETLTKEAQAKLLSAASNPWIVNDTGHVFMKFSENTQRFLTGIRTDVNAIPANKIQSTLEGSNPAKQRDIDNFKEFYKYSENGTKDFYLALEAWAQGRFGYIAKMLNPQNSKLARSIVGMKAFEVTVDPKNKDMMDVFKSSIMDRIGEKTNKASVRAINGRFNKLLKAPATIAAIEAYKSIKDSESTIENEHLILDFAYQNGINSEALEVLDALANYSKTKKFKTSLRIDADGTTNGIMLGYAIYAKHDPNFRDIMAKGGFLTDPNADYLTEVTKPGFKDVYETMAGAMNSALVNFESQKSDYYGLPFDSEVTDFPLSGNLGRFVRSVTFYNPARKKEVATLRSIGQLLDRHKSALASVFKLDRSAAKTPTTVISFGASINTATNDTVEALMDAMYESVLEARTNPSDSGAKYIADLNAMLKVITNNPNVEQFSIEGENSPLSDKTEAALAGSLQGVYGAVLEVAADRVLGTFMESRTTVNEMVTTMGKAYVVAYYNRYFKEFIAKVQSQGTTKEKKEMSVALSKLDVSTLNTTQLAKVVATYGSKVKGLATDLTKKEIRELVEQKLVDDNVTTKLTMHNFAEGSGIDFVKLNKALSVASSPIEEALNAGIRTSAKLMSTEAATSKLKEIRGYLKNFLFVKDSSGNFIVSADNRQYLSLIYREAITASSNGDSNKALSEFFEKYISLVESPDGTAMDAVAAEVYGSDLLIEMKSILSSNKVTNNIIKVVPNYKGEGFKGISFEQEFQESFGGKGAPKILEAVGVGVPISTIHNLDGAITLETIGHSPSSNQHDSNGHGLDTAISGVTNTNKFTIDTLRDPKSNYINTIANMYDAARYNKAFAPFFSEGLAMLGFRATAPEQSVEEFLHSVDVSKEALRKANSESMDELYALKSSHNYFLPHSAAKENELSQDSTQEDIDSAVAKGVEDFNNTLGSSPGGIGNFQESSRSTVDATTATALFDQVVAMDPRAVNQGHTAYLRDLMESMVTKVMKPVLVVLDTTSTTTKGEYNSVGQPMVSLALGNSSLANSSLLSSGEVYVHEMLHHISEAYLSGKADSAVLKQLRRLFAAAERHMTVEDLYMTNNPSATEKREAQNLYNYIFRNTASTAQTRNLSTQNIVITQNRNNYLHEFFAFGLSNQRVLKALTKPEIARAFNDSTFERFTYTENKLGNLLANMANKLLNIFFTMLNNLEMRSLGVKNVNADYALKTLAAKLVNSQVEHTAKLSKTGEFVDTINSKALSAVSDYIRAPLAKLFPEGKIAGARVPVASPLLSATLNSQGVTSESVAFVLDKWTANMGMAKNGFVKSVAREMLGTTKSNSKFHALLRYSSNFIDRERANVAASASKYIKNSFSYGLTSDEKEASYYGLLKTDAGVLLDSTSTNMPEVLELLTDQTARLSEIRKLKRELATLSDAKALKYYEAQISSLSNVMVTGIPLLAGGRTLNNAYQIARATNNNYVQTANEEEVEVIIDKLLTLSALQHVDNFEVSSKLKAIHTKDMESGKTLQESGILTTLEMLNLHKQKSLKENFDNDKSLQIKGYVKEKLNPNTSVIVSDNPAEIEKYKNMGYEVVKEKVRRFTEKGQPARNKTMLVSSVHGLRKYQAGIFSLTAFASKGTDVDAADTVAIKELADRLNKASSYELSPQSIGTKGTTVPGQEHSQFRYLMTEQTKRDVVGMSTAFDDILGSMFGAIVDKNHTTVINKQGMSLIVDDYNDNFRKERSQFVFLNEESEQMRLLPEKIRKELLGKFDTRGVPVREGLIPLIFGQRKLSVGALSENELQKSANQMVRLIGNGMATLGSNTKVLRAEIIWQDIMKMVKDWIVIKSGFVMTGNIVSNLVVNAVEGVSMRNQLKYSLEGVKAVTDYRKLKSLLSNLQLQVESKSNLSTSESRDLKSRIARIKEEIAKNPVKDLIDEGVLQSIIEDVEMEDTTFSFMSELDKVVEPVGKRTPGFIKDVGKQMFITHDTALYGFLRDSTQLSDFVARYALFKHNEAKGMDKAANIDYVMETFIDYDLPTHRAIQYGNDMGFLLFTKFFLRIQKVILRQATTKTASLLASVWAQQLVEVPDISDAVASYDGMYNRSTLFPIGHLDNLLQIPSINIDMTPR